LVGETEILGENLPQCRFVHHKPHMAARTRTLAAAVGSQRLTAELRHGLVIVVSQQVDVMPSEDGRLTETCKGNKYLQIESHLTVLTIIL
jgi:hypothetical protein